MDIIMRSNIFIVTKIIKKSKARMFENLQIGDRLLFTTPIEYIGRGGGGGTYAVDIKIENLSNKDFTYKSFNQLPSILRNFEFEEEV